MGRLDLKRGKELEKDRHLALFKRTHDFAIYGYMEDVIALVPYTTRDEQRKEKLARDLFEYLVTNCVRV